VNCSEEIKVMKSKALGAESCELVSRHTLTFFYEFFNVFLKCPNDLENSNFSVKQHLALIFLK